MRSDRRRFLKGMGSFSLALPFLPSLSSSAEAASAPGIAKRFIAIHNGHCQAVEQWLPDPTRFTFTSRDVYAREVALSSIGGPISPVLNSAFDSLRAKLLLLSRLDPTSTNPNHNAEVILSGGVRSEIQNTLDHVIGKKLSGASPLNLYVKSVFDSNYSGASHASVANGAYSVGQFNPSALFASLFGTSNSNGNTADSGASRRDLLAVDRVLKEFQALRQNRRLSSADGQRLDRHIELIFEVEKKLKASASGTMMSICQSPIGPVSSPVRSDSASDYQTVIDQMFDVLEVGMKCGKVQVATVMLHVYDYFAGSVGFIPGVSGNVKLHEDIGHAGSSEMRAMKLQLNLWFGQRVARFLKNLDVIEDPVANSTYLDNSLILWANDQGALQSTGAHASINLPVLLAGSAGGFLKTGRYIDYGPAYDPALRRPVGGDEGMYKRGRPYNQLLITIAQAMGLQPSDYETTGAQGFGVYGGRTSAYDYLPGNHRREVLPYIAA